MKLKKFGWLFVYSNSEKSQAVDDEADDVVNLMQLSQKCYGIEIEQP